MIVTDRPTTAGNWVVPRHADPYGASGVPCSPFEAPIAATYHGSIGHLHGAPVTVVGLCGCRRCARNPGLGRVVAELPTGTRLMTCARPESFTAAPTQETP